MKLEKQKQFRKKASYIIFSTLDCLREWAISQFVEAGYDDIKMQL